MSKRDKERGERVCVRERGRQGQAERHTEREREHEADDRAKPEEPLQRKFPEISLKQCLKQRNYQTSISF